jgi:competence ComEA-like helix-hairpin-helix protein
MGLTEIAQSRTAATKKRGQTCHSPFFWRKKGNDTSGPFFRPIFFVILFAVPVVFAWAATEPALPDGPGKETFVSVCSLCHMPTAPMGKQWTRQQWESKVTEMLQEEPDVTREERAAIVEYLTANFKPGGKIYINMAKAADLETALDISEKDAATLFRYRAENGEFKTLEDLKKFSFLNAARMESLKDRIVF